MNIEKPIVRIWNLEDNGTLEKKGFNSIVAKTNVDEHGQSSNTYKNMSMSSGGKGA